ncbi:hypothetical protein C8R45DRAFT_942491 [Mycena sanguinolenta]|nr:hypothetical protein C8R45DRAFT_942491 [Mycena sanguinolenta]
MASAIFVASLRFLHGWIRQNQVDLVLKFWKDVPKPIRQYSIVTQTRDQFIWRNFNCHIQPGPHSSSDFPDDRPQVTVHVFPTFPACLILLNRSSPRTAAIATSVVTVIVVFTLGIVLVRMRKRNLRIREHRTPDQFLNSQEHIVPKPPAKNGTVPAGAESAEPEVNQSNLLGAPMLDDTETKQTRPRDDPDNAPSTDIPVVAPEESAATPSDPRLEVVHEEETMGLRMRRLKHRWPLCWQKAHHRAILVEVSRKQ